MVDWLSLLFALILAFVMALIESLLIGPGPLSQAELERRASRGDAAAKAELGRRELLPLYFGLQRIKVSILVVAIIGILVGANELWLGLLLSLVVLLLVAVVVAMRLLQPLVRMVQPSIEPFIWQAVRALAVVLKVFAPRVAAGEGFALASKDELKQLITQDISVLSADEKAHLLSSLEFGTKTVAGAMVPREKIVTVGVNETVGPLLLDRLHKAGHNIFVAVKKDLNNVEGLLYMSDLVPLDEDIKKVSDAIRPKVYYIADSSNLAAVLAASLKTGRQLFLAVDKQGNISGLVTLADTLQHAFGAHLNKDAAVATDPKKLA